MLSVFSGGGGGSGDISAKKISISISFFVDTYLQRGQGIIVRCKANIRRVALKVGVASFTEHEIHSIRARSIGHIGIAR